MNVPDLSTLIADAIRERTGSENVRLWISVVDSRRYISVEIDGSEFLIQVDKES